MEVRCFYPDSPVASVHRDPPCIPLTCPGVCTSGLFGLRVRTYLNSWGAQPERRLASISGPRSLAEGQRDLELFLRPLEALVVFICQPAC